MFASLTGFVQFTCSGCVIVVGGVYGFPTKYDPHIADDCIAQIKRLDRWLFQLTSLVRVRVLGTSFGQLYATDEENDTSEEEST